MAHLNLLQQSYVIETVFVSFYTYENSKPQQFNDFAKIIEHQIGYTVDSNPGF